MSAPCFIGGFMNSPAAQPQPSELPAHSPTPVELEISRVRELTKARRYGQALGALEPLLSQFPENRDALYLQAMNLRFLNRFEEALGVLERLQQLHPRYSRLYQEREPYYSSSFGRLSVCYRVKFIF